MSESSTPRLPAFDPGAVTETNFTSYPEPYRAANSTRYNRRLARCYALLASAPSIMLTAFCTPYTATNEPKRGPFS